MKKIFLTAVCYLLIAAGSDPQTDVTSWQLTDEKNLVIDTDSYVIEELSATTLKMKQIVTGLYGETLTLTKR